MPTAQSIIDDFLRKLATKTDWPEAPPVQMLRVVRFLREYKDLDPTIIDRASVIINRPTWDLHTLAALPDPEVLQSFEWEALTSMGPGANTQRTRDWADYPHTGFFGDYLEYTANSEGPLDFHFFSAATVLGGACKRNFVFRFGHSNIWPNIWVVLLAPSGACRKTSTINIGTKLLRSMSDITFITTCATPEALVQQLKPVAKDSLYTEATGELEFQYTESQGFIAAPELGVFLGKQQYNEGLIQKLTDLSDNPDEWSSGTKSEGKSELRNVALSLLGGITPESARDALPRSAHGGGFMSRILWIRAETTPRVIPHPPAPSPLLRERLRLHLKRVRDAQPTILMPSDDALEFFVAWYINLRAERPEDDRLAGFIERQPTNLWRIAMLLFLGQSDAKVETIEGDIRIGRIDLSYLQTANGILQRISADQHEAARVVDSAPVSNNLRVLRNALWNLTRGGKERVQRSDLMRRVSSRMYQYELNQLLGTLIQSEELLPPIVEQRNGKDTTFYEIGSKFTH